MHVKHKAKASDVFVIAARLKAVDYDLIGICTGPDCPLTIRTAERLAKLQRQLRMIRYDIECEAGIEAPEMSVPKRAPGGGPQFRVIQGDRRGEASARFV